MSYQTISYNKEDGIGEIKLRRPDKYNALNIKMRDELYEVFLSIKDDPDVGVVLIGGEGRAFCSGADISEFGTAPSRVIARDVRWERDLWGLIYGMDEILICLMHGYALGAGLEMAMLCDFRLAAFGTKFGLPEVNLGMIPTATGTQTLPRLINLGKALEIIFTGKFIGCDEALRLGLIHRAVPQNELYGEGKKLARRILSLPQVSIKFIKEAMRRGLDLSLDEAIRVEGVLFRKMRGEFGGAHR